MSVDEELGLVYLPVEMPTGDYYGGHRPGNEPVRREPGGARSEDRASGSGTTSSSITASGTSTFRCAPILADITVNGRPIKAVAQPTKQAFLYVFDRVTGQPVWPIEERPVPERQTCRANGTRRRSRSRPSRRRTIARACRSTISSTSRRSCAPKPSKLVSRYKIGPLFTPPSVSKWEGPLGTAHGAPVNGRHELAGRRLRSGDEHPLRLFLPQPDVDRLASTIPRDRT